METIAVTETKYSDGTMGKPMTGVGFEQGAQEDKHYKGVMLLKCIRVSYIQAYTFACLGQ
jgi:hypothetical protein